MRAHWATTLGLCLGLISGSARADEIQWRPAGSRRAAPKQAAPAAAKSERPAATLGTPVLRADAPTESAATRDGNVARASYNTSEPPPYTVRGQSPDASGPTLAPPPGLNAVPAGPEVLMQGDRRPCPNHFADRIADALKDPALGPVIERNRRKRRPRATRSRQQECGDQKAPNRKKSKDRSGLSGSLPVAGWLLFRLGYRPKLNFFLVPKCLGGGETCF